MSTYEFTNPETGIELIIDDDQRFTLVGPGFDICTEKVGPKLPRSGLKQRLLLRALWGC